MQLPLRLQLKPSRCYFLFLASGHILAGVAVCLLPWPLFARMLVVMALGVQMGWLWRTAMRQLPALLLRQDGKVEVALNATDAILAEVGPDTVVWPWLVVLHLKAPTLKPLMLFPDGLVDSDAHRQLRVWLRWRNQHAEAGLDEA